MADRLGDGIPQRPAGRCGGLHPVPRRLAELEGLLLQSWLGRTPDRTLRARLVLIRQLVRLFYGCAASLHAANLPDLVPETDLAALTPAEFRAAVDEGRLVAGAPQTQRIGGKVALATFLAVLGHAGFRGSARRRPPGLTGGSPYPRSTLPALASLSLPCSQVTAPLTTVYSTPRDGMTMRLAPPGRS